MLIDINRHISSCSVCAQAKGSQVLSVGKLVPLPRPQRPWSHIAIDFITDILKSQGNTVMVIIDHFSISLKFIPLPGLPTAFWFLAKLNFYPCVLLFWYPRWYNQRLRFPVCALTVVKVHRQTGSFSELDFWSSPTVKWSSEKGQPRNLCFLRVFCAKSHRDWMQFLPWDEYA